LHYVCRQGTCTQSRDRSRSIQNRDRTECAEEQDATERGIILQQGAGQWRNTVNESEKIKIFS
jgi:hypothetical protein